MWFPSGRFNWQQRQYQLNETAPTRRPDTSSSSSPSPTMTHTTTTNTGSSANNNLRLPKPTANKWHLGSASSSSTHGSISEAMNLAGARREPGAAFACSSSADDICSMASNEQVQHHHHLHHDTSQLSVSSSGRGDHEQSCSSSHHGPPTGATGAGHDLQPPASNQAPRLRSKDKRRRQKEEAERVEKLKLLVSYLRNGSSQDVCLKPVELEADEIELAERYKLHLNLCDECLGDHHLEEDQLGAWTNPQNLATWIDNEVNSLVNDLELTTSQLFREEKQSKSGPVGCAKRRWFSSGSNSRRSSSGTQST